MNVDYSIDQILNPTIQTKQEVENYNQFALLGVCVDDGGTAVTLGKEALMGMQGVQGPAGSGGGGSGSQGAQGVQGIQGRQGARGQTGNEGPAGPTGPQGPAGPVQVTNEAGIKESVIGNTIFLPLPGYETFDVYDLANMQSSIGSNDIVNFNFYTDYSGKPMEYGYYHHVLIINSLNRKITLTPIYSNGQSIWYFIERFDIINFNDQRNTIRIPSTKAAYLTYYLTNYTGVPNRKIANITVGISDISCWSRP